jgi:hypothetical protein
VSLLERKDIQLSEAEKYLLSLYSLHGSTLDRPRPEPTRSTDSQGMNTFAFPSLPKPAHMFSCPGGIKCYSRLIREGIVIKDSGYPPSIQG